jgi:hypothetical protein
LVEHDLDVVAGVPVAVIIETANLLEHALAELFDKSAIALTQYLKRETTTFDEIADINRKIIRLSQSILKREWIA